MTRLELNFGSLPAGNTATQLPPSAPFRIAVIGDFSGRANRGQLQAIDPARRKPIRIDADNLEAVIRSFASVLRLPLASDGGSIELRPSSLDDLHPDALYENLEVFSELSALRDRLTNPRTSQAAVATLRETVQLADGPALPATLPRARGGALSVDAMLGDFARLVGRPTVPEGEPTPADALARQVVAPYLVESPDPNAGAWTAVVDRASTDTMRAILHHPDFQALESAWRSLDFLVRRVDTGSKLQLVLFDISAEEFAADLCAGNALEETGLYRLLVEQMEEDAHQGRFSAFIANYSFEMTPPHAQVLGRMARIAARSQAPFVAAIGANWSTTRREDLHPLILDAWDALRALPEAAYLALAAPRFLLRAPYGARSEPIDAFDFEEFDARSGLRGMLWGNPAIVVGTLLARNFATPRPARTLTLDDMPYFFYTDADGESLALPCTEKLLPEAKAAHVLAQGFLPLLALKGRPQLRTAGFMSVCGKELAGRWTPAEQLPALRATSGIQAATAQAERATTATVVDEVENADADPEVPDPVQNDAEPHDGGGDAELAALLADLAATEQEANASAADIDPDLAALLADL